MVVFRVKRNNQHWKECDDLSTVSKQLYNVGLYALRQALIHENKWLSPKELYQCMKSNENWTLLPRKVSNQVWKQVKTNWNSWLKALKAFRKNPSKFLGRPKMPKYKSDRNIVIYEKGALGKRGLKDGFRRLSKTGIIFDTMGLDIVEAKIIPKSDCYVISIIYKKEVEKDESLGAERIASFDLGLNNLVAIATNQVAVPHKLVNGRYLKSLNHHWNKQKARLQSNLPRGKHWSKRLERLTQKRNNRIDTHLHRMSRNIIDWLISNKIGTIIIGKSSHWKNKIKLGKKNNQHFVQIPHARLIEMLQYKFEEIGGLVILTEESYTSKASALDLDRLPVYGKETVTRCFSGSRVKRGLYKSKNGHLINADINGALNIMRKVSKKSIDDLVSDKQFIHYCASPTFLEMVR